MFFSLFFPSSQLTVLILEKGERNDYTDDTDQTILLIQSLTDTNGSFSGSDFAKVSLFFPLLFFVNRNRNSKIGVGKVFLSLETKLEEVWKKGFFVVTLKKWSCNQGLE